MYLGVIQFFFAAMWIVYVLFLPQLAESVGIPRSFAIWILLLDQVVFAFTDFAMGLAADRVERGIGRLGPAIAAITAVSCFSFLALPLIAQPGSASPTTTAIFVFLLVVWAVTSSALRAPPWVLIIKYAANPTIPWLAAIVLVGVSAAAAISPYLGLVLRDIDPRIPFAMSSGVLLATTAGLVWVERGLARGAPATAMAQPSPQALGPLQPGTRAGFAVAAFVFTVLVLGLGYQANISFVAFNHYLRFASEADLQYLNPIFFVGFNLLSLPACAMTPRWGGARVMLYSAALGVFGVLLSALAPNLALTIVGQLLAGAAWGAIFIAAMATFMWLGRTGSEGSMTGLWFSTQAVAALFRIGIVATQFDRAPGFGDIASWAPPALWLLGVLVLAGLLWQASSQRTLVPSRTP